MRNSLGDLNNHLFEQLERLNDDELTDEQLRKEMKRADSMTKVAGQIIDNANTVLKAQIAFDENIQRDAKKPKMLEG